MGDLGIPTEKLESRSEIQKKFLEEFEKLDGNKLKEFVKKFEVKYVIRKKEKREEETFLKDVFKTENFYIYEIKFEDEK
jgi:hypothetical protein